MMMLSTQPLSLRSCNKVTERNVGDFQAPLRGLELKVAEDSGDSYFWMITVLTRLQKESWRGRGREEEGEGKRK